MKARLFSKTGAIAGTEFSFEHEAVLGRDNQCDIVLYPHTISVRHARIYAADDGSGYWIEDLGSSNGTSVDRTQVTGPMRLDQLHVITLAQDIDLIFQVLPDRYAPAEAPARPRPAAKGTQTTLERNYVPPPNLPPSIPAQPGTMTTLSRDFDIPDIPLHGTPPPDTAEEPTLKAVPPPQPPREQPPREQAPRQQAPQKPPARPQPRPDSGRTAPPVTASFTLVVTSGSGQQRYTLKPGENVVGRSSACDIAIKDEYLSGRHAVLQVRGLTVTLRDLGSSNRTFVDGQPIETEVQIQPGTPLRFGPLTKAVLES